MTKNELDILNRLSNMQNYIWKPADKGGAIVLMNLMDYLIEVNKHLSDQFFYRELPHDPINKIKSLIRMVCSEGLAMGYITMQTFEFLQNQYPRTPIFYVLHKIHKGITPPPGRPIVCGTSSVLEPLAKYLNHFLQPFVLKSQSYIKDTTHFINTIESLYIPQQCTLMSLDIASLYTNIPLNEIRTIIQDLFDSRESKIPPTHFLVDLLDIVLDNNYFRFDSKYYLQIWGIAMGSSLAPSAANLSVSHLETIFIFNKIHNPYLTDMLYYGRFLDDIFTIFNSYEKAQSFSDWINTIHPNMKFTSTISSTNINFLDVIVHKDGNGVYVTN
uniref:Reverse transcriptase domain-containing protein n=1 Tax=Anolis carolinensis TaxID=28377 RepID=A0A803TNU1_ANOCA